MSTPQLAGPPISPDGHYWWDGQAWQPMPAAAPAPAPAPPVAVEAPPSWLAAPPQAAAPAPSAAAVGAYEPAPTPAAWVTPQPPTSRTWVYLAGFLIVAIIFRHGVVGYRRRKTAGN